MFFGFLGSLTFVAVSVSTSASYEVRAAGLGDSCMSSACASKSLVMYQLIRGNGARAFIQGSGVEEDEVIVKLDWRQLELVERQLFLGVCLMHEVGGKFDGETFKFSLRLSHERMGIFGPPTRLYMRDSSRDDLNQGKDTRPAHDLVGLSCQQIRV